MPLVLYWPAKSKAIVVSLVLFFFPYLVLASESCGTITGPESLTFQPYEVDIVTTEISNCEDPFAVTINPPSPYTLLVEGTPVSPGGTVTVVGGRTQDIRVQGVSYNSDYVTFLYRHEGNSYVYVNQQVPEPVLNDYLYFADTYFTTASDSALYSAIIEAYFKASLTFCCAVC